MRGVLIASAVVAGLAQHAVAADCAGNACSALKFDTATCTMTNVGDQPVKVSVYASPVSISYDSIPPGKSVDASVTKGCIKPGASLRYSVDLVAGQPKGDTPTGVAIARKMGFGGQPPCIGARCNVITLAVKDLCLWVSNYSSSAATVVLRLDVGAVSLDLLPVTNIARPTTTGPASTSSSTAVSADTCNRARASQKLFGESGLPPEALPPELLGTIAKCDAADKAAKAQQATPIAPAAGPEAGYYVSEFDAIQLRDFQVFTVRPRTAAGCVGPTDVVDYTVK